MRLHAEGGGDLIVGGAPAQRFKPGGHVIVRASYPILSTLRLQAGSGNFWFPANQGQVGRLITAEGGLRFSPMYHGEAKGLVLEGDAGLGLTGSLQRFTFNFGLGWDFMLSRSVSLGPVVTYTHLLQPDNQANPDDARLLGLGVALTLGVPPTHKKAEDDPDHDGIVGAADKCPYQPEDFDGYQDSDGCPDPDNDHDGIPDKKDKCPNQPETFNGYEDEDGCPDVVPPKPAPAKPETPSSKPEVEQHGTMLPERVHFRFRSDYIRSGEYPLLRRVCRYAKAHPDVRLRIHGHASEVGTEDFNYQLSAKRAAAAATWLMHCGIDGRRLEVKAHGDYDPLCKSHTPACNAKNRRVQFEVLKPSE